MGRFVFDAGSSFARPSAAEHVYEQVCDALRAPGAAGKAVVFSLVDMYLVLGEDLTPHLAELSTSQLKLVTIYINRTTKARADQLDLQQHE